MARKCSVRVRCLPLRPRGLVARTRDFHSRNRSSILLGDTNLGEPEGRSCPLQGRPRGSVTLLFHQRSVSQRQTAWFGTKQTEVRVLSLRPIFAAEVDSVRRFVANEEIAGSRPAGCSGYRKKSIYITTSLRRGDPGIMYGCNPSKGSSTLPRASTFSVFITLDR